MAGKVLDAHGLLAYLEGGSNSESVIKLLQKARDSRRHLLVSSVTWSDVYCLTTKELGRKRAEELAELVATLPIEIVPTDQRLAEQAASLRVEHKLPYTQSYAAALAKLQSAKLATGDARLKPLEGEVKIEWL